MTIDEIRKHLGTDGELRISLGTLRAGRGESGQPPVIRGYAIVFDVLSENLGGFRERIAPEAVTRTLHENIDVRAFVDHDPSKIIGRVSAGTLRLRADSKGLKSEIDPPNTSAARDIVESIRRGDVTGMSFAFRTLTDDWNMEDGVPVRTVLDMRISEVSVVSVPAYTSTTADVALRSLARYQGATGAPIAAMREELAKRVAKVS
jgi:HK97 family phage prohead protease